MLNGHRNIPLLTTVFYPTIPGNYAPILFLPGLNGLVYPELYSTVMSNFAAYGYIVAGVDPFWPAVSLTKERLKDQLTQERVPGVVYVSEKLPDETFHLLQWVICSVQPLSDFLPSPPFYH